MFLYTDHKNNTFRSKIQPTRRVTKKLLKMCIEIEPMQIERVYIAGEDNLLGDAPSGAPADHEVARNLVVPLAPISPGSPKVLSIIFKTLCIRTQRKSIGP